MSVSLSVESGIFLVQKWGSFSDMNEYFSRFQHYHKDADILFYKLILFEFLFADENWNTFSQFAFYRIYSHFVWKKSSAAFLEHVSVFVGEINN